MPSPDPVAIRDRFAAALTSFHRANPVWLLGHNDADGLSSLALLARAFAADGWTTRTRIVGRGESPWSDAMATELAGESIGGLVIADLGVRRAHPRPDVPTIVLDHHVPQGEPAGATVITGHGLTPEPTTSLLAFWCAGALVSDPEPWLWLAGLGLIGDMADEAGFDEFARARAFGVTALRDATALVNAPRRTASGDASPALRLLIESDGPKAITTGATPDALTLRAAREEVKSELAAARKVAPKMRDGVALILFSSPCQIHPLIAQQWRGRLKGETVIAANVGYRPGWVHFAVRSARPIDLVAFLAEHRPPGADEQYGSGHKAATGGALRPGDWMTFLRSLGFDGLRELAA